MRRRLLPSLAAVLLAGACAEAFPAPAPAAVAAPARPSGYLAAELLERLGQAAPAAPATGSAVEAADRARSAGLALLADTPRWTLAQTHAEVSPALALAHFDCPLGTRLSQDPPPALARLFARALRDASVAANAAKGRLFRARPFVDDPARRVCVRVEDDLGANSSHPSGHAVAGAVYGEIMAELAPDQAGELRRRGREIGWSRAVCGLHYPADAEAGLALGAEVHRALQASPEYRADLAAARAELDERRRRDEPGNPGCAAERAALALGYETPAP